jgi:phage terminase large subunit-like protein
MYNWEDRLKETVQLIKPLSEDKDADPYYKEVIQKLVRMPKEALELRYRAMDDLYTYARLVNPGYVYGDIHKEAFRWMQEYSLFGQNSEKSANKLIMFPRAHLKSHMVATWCSWMITRHPDITILYLSATAELAEIQLYSIKAIMESGVYQRFWPEYIHSMEGKRSKWTERKIIIDHPIRTKEGIRDATVATAGLTTNTTGWHSDVLVPDDLVVPENAYTEEGRNSVAKKSSQFTSIRNAGGFTMACGTRYHPADIYDTWKNQEYDIYDDDGNVLERKKVWEVMEKTVEEDGIFLWPRTVRPDGKAFGFNQNELSRIRSEYEDKTQFFAQYYNNPNDPGSERINRNCFQYYDQRHVRHDGSNWYVNSKKVNVYAAIDFAFSLNKRADYTAITVIGVDSEGYIYVLDLERFRTDKIAEYFKKIAELHSKWDFKKLRAEVTVAQQIIVNDIKDHVRKEGLRLIVEDHRPTRSQGSKEERIAATLEHRYENRQVFHFKGGLTPVLEEELIQARPKNDDLKDSLACAVEIAIKPKAKKKAEDFMLGQNNNKFNSRFGGINFR